LTICYFPPISDFANKLGYHALRAGNLNAVVAEVANFLRCEK